jgi:AcrR family transcriptional regulator
MPVEITTELFSPSERERALRAMADLCEERGYEELAIEEVIERSGVAPDAFVAMFADKEACARAAVDAILAEVMTTVSARYSADRAERDSYLMAIMAILELLAERPGFAYISLICARQMGPSSLFDGLETGARMLSAMLERLRDEGEQGRPPPGSAARAALGGAEAVVRREIAAGRTQELPRLLPDFVYGATVSFLGQEEALRIARRGRELLSGGRWG